MGHRANFVIIQNSIAKLYQGSWAAVDCIYYFADGPEGALKNATEKSEADRFYDWAFAEGGYLLDFDNQLAIVFGDSIPNDEIRVADRKTHPEIERINIELIKGEKHYLKLVSKLWPSWILIWDQRGVDAFSEYLVQNSFDTVPVLKPSHPKKIKSPVRLDPERN